MLWRSVMAQRIDLCVRDSSTATPCLGHFLAHTKTLTPEILLFNIFLCFAASVVEVWASVQP